jgi:cell wall-associated NlpC family hydrolase
MVLRTYTTLIWLSVVIVLSGCNLLRLIPPSEPVTPEIASQALTIARSQIGDPYEWGGDGPDTFDCSGLVVYSYQSAYRATHIFSDGKQLVDDVTADTLFRHNIQPVEPEQLIPGDLIFISSESDRITHVGIVADIQKPRVEMVHASSFAGEVLEEHWPLEQVVRNQHVVGFGRLLTSSR